MAKAARQRKGLAENFYVESSGSESDEDASVDESAEVEEIESEVSDHASLPKTQAAQPKKNRKGASPASPGRESSRFAVEDEEVSPEGSDRDAVAENSDAEADYWARKARGELEESEEDGEGDWTGDEFSTDSEYDEEDMAAEEYDKGVFQQEMAYGEETHRIAIVNCDWDHLKAVDILVVCSSFCPSTGLVKSVTIYPSDFGLSMMAEEDLNGPSVYKNGDESDSEEEDTKGGKKVRSEERQAALDEIKLRRYELNKLRYYFAVVTCDSISTAAAIYGALDNQELEMTANKLDMRFVPDDISFEDRAVHDVANEIPLNYEPPNFETTVLKKTEAKLTWDQTPKERLAVTQAAFSHLGDIDEAKYAKYIASSESEGEDSEEESDGELDGIAPTKDDDDADVAHIKKKERKKYASLLLGLDGLEEEEDKNDHDDFFTALETAGAKSKKNKKSEGEMEFSFGGTSKADTKSGKSKEWDEEEVKRKVQEKLSAKPKKSFKANNQRSVVPKYRPDEKHSDDEEEAENGSDVDESESGDMPSLIPAAGSKKDKKGDKKAKFMEKKQQKREEQMKKNGKSKKDSKMDVDEEEGEEGNKDVWAGFEEAFEKPSKAKLAKMKKRKREEREKEMREDTKSRAELSLLVGKKDDEDSDSDIDAPRSKKSKKDKKAPVTSQINLKDDRFSALMEDPRFLPDPTNPNFKKTASVKAILDARKEYRQAHGLEEAIEDESHQSTFKASVASSSQAKTSKSDSKQNGHKKTVQKGFYDLGAQQDEVSSKAELDDLVASVKRKAASTTRK